MKISFLFLFILFVFQFSVVRAQNAESQQPICFEPFSQKFAEIDFTNSEETKKTLEEFNLKLSEESEQAKGYIFVYGGKKTKVKEVDVEIEKVKKILQIGEMYLSKFWVLDGGFRAAPTIELFIKPLNCSQSPTGVSDFSVDQLEFVEAPKENTLKKSSTEIESSLVKKSVVECSPAASAVRACNNDSTVEVFVVIDQKGNVIFSKAVSGHPLNRLTGARAVKNWKFNPSLVNGKNFNALGYITVNFQEPKISLEIITN
jgi:hypothetical protein